MLMHIWEWKMYKLYRKLNARNPNLDKPVFPDIAFDEQFYASMMIEIEEAEWQRIEQAKEEKEYWKRRNEEFNRRLRQIESQQKKEAERKLKRENKDVKAKWLTKEERGELKAKLFSMKIREERKADRLNKLNG